MKTVPYPESNRAVAVSPSPLSHRARSVRNAFSMAELLVALAVLSLISVIVAQLVNSSGKVAMGSRMRLDAEGQARLVLGRIGDDLARRVRLRDADCLFVAANGNDSMYFYSEAPAAFGSGTVTQDKSGVALIGYRIAGAGSENENQLERLGKGLKWAGATSGKPDSMILVSIDSAGAALPGSRMTNAFSSVVGAAPSYNDGVDSTYQLLSDGVIRLEIAFLKKDGTITQDVNGDGSRIASSLDDVAAVIVTIAVLDEYSQKQITKAKLAQIASALGDPTPAELSANPPVLMARKWQSELSSPAFATSVDAPASVIAKIRAYQRIYPLKAL
ncbi:hypothetical protein DB346_24975 [Verrucomicrobia bacterium LW23]|nr:hypothetical protein DB346_24975 [Verrucomicrobia bacterium LW23]